MVQMLYNITEVSQDKNDFSLFFLLKKSMRRSQPASREPDSSRIHYLSAHSGPAAGINESCLLLCSNVLVLLLLIFPNMFFPFRIEKI